MSICSDVSIKRQDAVEQVFKILMGQQEELIRKAVNGMSNLELAIELGSEIYYYTVIGKGKLKTPREK